jgi:hypothetical protein
MARPSAPAVAVAATEPFNTNSAVDPGGAFTTKTVCADAAALRIT